MNKAAFIYGTLNPAKLQVMRECLAALDIEIVGLEDIDSELPDIDESGSSPIENARIKALAYYKVLKRPVFACDSGIYIEGLPDSEQPGVHIRRVNNKRLNDEEMTNHYAALAAKLGGKAVAQYRNAICLVMNENEIHEYFGEDLFGKAFYIADKPHPKRVEGFPLDCLSIHIESGEYYYNRPDEVTSSMEVGFQTFFCNILKY